MSEINMGVPAPKRQISGAWFILPVGLFLLSLVGAALFIGGIFGFVDMDKQYIMVDADGTTGTVTVEEAGNYQLYYEQEYPSHGHMGYYYGMAFTFTNRDTGAVAVSHAARYNSNYNFGGVSGRLAAEVYLSPGTWDVDGGYEDGTYTGRALTFILTPGFRAGMLVLGIFALVGGVFAFIGAVASLVVILVVRSQRNKPPVPPYYAPQPWPAPPPAPQQAPSQQGGPYGKYP